MLTKIKSRLVERRTQLTTVASLVHVPFLIVLFLIFLIRSPLSRRYLGIKLGRWCFAAYLFWMIWFDFRTPRRGGRPYQTMRQAHIWQIFRDYFPVEVIKKAHIDPSKKYVLGVHPHGIMGIAAWASIISDAGVFPGLNYRVLTVSSNFAVPLWRDVLMGMGMVDCSRDSCSYLLQHNISVAVVVGGAAEALDARPGTNDLTLTRRLGFVRLALENGADLIPIFSFGENDLFEQVVPNPPNSLTRSIQERMMSWFGYSLPLVTGRFGFIPHRRPITTIIGEPIHVPHIPKPTLPQILEVHGRYVRALQSLFDEYRPIVYTLHPDHPMSDLRLVDRMRSRDVHKLVKREAKMASQPGVGTVTPTTANTDGAIETTSIPSELSSTLNSAVNDLDENHTSSSTSSPLAERVAKGAQQLQTSWRRARL